MKDSTTKEHTSLQREQFVGWVDNSDITGRKDTLLNCS